MSLATSVSSIYRSRASIVIGLCVFGRPYEHTAASLRASMAAHSFFFAHLRELGKPFVVIMPCSTLTTRYFQDLFQDIQVIVPRSRIQFRKMVDGVEVPSGRCSFDCLYFCWRLASSPTTSASAW